MSTDVAIRFPPIKPAMHFAKNFPFLGKPTPEPSVMRSIHKGKTPQQILDYYPHSIPQPDTEEARQARVAQRFRLEFLLGPSRQLATLGKKAASAERTSKAQAAIAEVNRANALMREPRNAFLMKDHEWHVDWLMTDLRALVG